MTNPFDRPHFVPPPPKSAAAPNYGRMMQPKSERITWHAPTGPGGAGRKTACGRPVAGYQRKGAFVAPLARPEQVTCGSCRRITGRP